MMTTQKVIKKIEYSDGDVTFEGVVAFHDQGKKKPMVMIVPTFKGQGDFEVKKAEEISELGYIGFAIDLYGKGVRATDPGEAGRLMNTLNGDRSLLLSRMKTSLEQARQLPDCDPHRIAMIGFCFGGKCVLDLARSGVTLSGGVSFHGIYDPPENSSAEITTPLLILHGWDDPLAPPESVNRLARELTEKKANWEIDAYGHTGHAFTNPAAKSPEQGMFYQAESSDRAWERMRLFLKQQFNKK